MVHELSNSLDHKKLDVDIAVLYYSKAFDKVYHTYLPIKLDLVLLNQMWYFGVDKLFFCQTVHSSLSLKGFTSGT